MKVFQSKLQSGDYHYDLLNADYIDPNTDQTISQFFSSNDLATAYTGQALNSMFRYSENAKNIKLNINDDVSDGSMVYLIKDGETTTTEFDYYYNATSGGWGMGFGVVSQTDLGLQKGDYVWIYRN
jgi:hypothetical protein